MHVAAHPQEFDCDKCKYSKHCTPENPSPFPQWNVNGEDLLVCPKGQVNHESAEWLRYYMHYTNGFLPVNGGLLEQTAKFIAAMEIIEGAKAGLDG